MSELEELKLAYAECSRQRNELLNKLKSQAQQEPVAWMSDVGSVASAHEKKMGYVLESAFTTPLYTSPPPQRERVVFPTMLRKMWSGGEVQAWLDENVNKENA